MNNTDITLLHQREIEAKIVGPIFNAFAKKVGAERAKEILAEVIRDLAKNAGDAAARSCGGDSLEHLGKAIENWTAGEALTLDIINRDEESLEFNVTRCRFAEMYRRLGLEELGPILSCGRDAAMIEGFNPQIDFQRTQTLMEGADYCDFRYRHKSIDQMSQHS